MDRSDAYHTSRRFLANVLISAGPPAPLSGAIATSGIIRSIRLGPDEPAFQCVAATEFALGGLKLQGEPALLGGLGPPAALTRGHGEDEGGVHVATTCHYAGLDVTIVRNRIDVIEAGSPRWSTPCGLKPGMEHADALRLLGREPDRAYLRDRTYSFVGSPEWRDGELTWDNASNHFEFGFDKDGRLSFIRLAADRP
ncbi:MAG: hypothetical protein JSU82_08665 [Rhodospirillales bacterium]|nr:MAG: hypothetical protein JSU82_08665 [Rhodospirillales bacterium]